MFFKSSLSSWCEREVCKIYLLLSRFIVHSFRTLITRSKIWWIVHIKWKNTIKKRWRRYAILTQTTRLVGFRYNLNLNYFLLWGELSRRIFSQCYLEGLLGSSACFGFLASDWLEFVVLGPDGLTCPGCFSDSTFGSGSLSGLELLSGSDCS